MRGSIIVIMLVDKQYWNIRIPCLVLMGPTTCEVGVINHAICWNGFMPVGTFGIRNLGSWPFLFIIIINKKKKIITPQIL